MQKLYLITLAVITACVCFAQNIYAQAGAFSYPPTLTLTTGQNMTPVNPTYKQGALQVQGVYSQASTLAGSGYYGHKDTSAAYSTFTNPVGIASFGTIIYIADANSNCIRKLEKGVVTTFAGSVKGAKGGINGQDTSARFNYPTSIAIDPSGNLYVTDFANSLIRKITPQGFVSTFAGNQNPGAKDGKGTAASFSAPYALCMDNNNNCLWVADTYNNMVRKITLTDATVKTMAGTGAQGFKNGAALSANFNTPKGITIDRIGNLYITEEGNNAVRKYDPLQGVVSTFTASKTLDKPVGIAFDGRLNNVYVSCEERYGIYKFNSDGKLADSTQFPAFSGGFLKGYVDATDTLTKMGGNMGLCVSASNNNLLVSDPGSDHIRQVSIYGYTVYPRLPDGLTISSTGQISGAPQKIAAAKDYVITGYSAAGICRDTISITVAKGKQIISFNAMTPVTYGDADFAVRDTSNSTASRSHTSDNPKVATIVNNKVHIVGAGTANITANQAASNNYAAADPVTQTLTVNKAHLKAIVYHYYKTQGSDNPDFTVYYSGYLRGDSITVIKQNPSATSTATKDSPPGDYPINMTGGLADNYDFTYTPGVLTVFPLPVIAVSGSTFAKGDSILLTATPTTGYSLQWYKDGAPIPRANGASYYAKESGAYTYSISNNGYTATSLYVSVTAQLQLPANNFSIKVTSVSCKGDNNGSIFISAAQSQNYMATVNGNGLVNQQYSFTDTLMLSKLSPGSYSVCIGVTNETFNQCFQLNITEPKDLSAYSTIDKPTNSINLQLDGGSTYSVNLNNQVYTTDKSEITLPLKAGINKLIITTDKLCQGIIEKNIDMSGITAPYPNPFTGVLNVNIGNTMVNNIKVDVVNVLNGKTVHTDQLNNKSGILQFDLSGMAAGVYYFNLNLDNNKLGYKIIKK